MIYQCFLLGGRESPVLTGRTARAGFLSPVSQDLKVRPVLMGVQGRRGQLASAWMGKMGLMVSLSQEFPARKVHQALKVFKVLWGMGLMGRMARMACRFLDCLGLKEAKDCLEMMVFLG